MMRILAAVLAVWFIVGAACALAAGACLYKAKLELEQRHPAHGGNVCSPCGDCLAKVLHTVLAWASLLYVPQLLAGVLYFLMPRGRRIPMIVICAVYGAVASVCALCLVSTSGGWAAALGAVALFHAGAAAVLLVPERRAMIEFSDVRLDSRREA